MGLRDSARVDWSTSHRVREIERSRTGQSRCPLPRAAWSHRGRGRRSPPFWSIP